MLVSTEDAVLNAEVTIKAIRDDLVMLMLFILNDVLCVV